MDQSDVDQYAAHKAARELKAAQRANAIARNKWWQEQRDNPAPPTAPPPANDGNQN